MNNTVKVFLKFLMGSGISIVISLLSGIIVSRSIGPEGKGIVAELLVIPSLLVPFAELGLRQSSIYFIGENYCKNKLSSTILIISIVSTITMSLVVYSILFFDDAIKDYTTFQLVAILMYIPIIGTIRPIFGIFLGEGQTTVYNNYRWGPPTVKFIFIVSFVIFFELGINEALISMFIGELVFIIYGLIHLSKFATLSLVNFDSKLAKGLITKGILFCLSFAIIQMNHRIDVLLLKEFKVASTNIGYYINGVGIAELVWQTPAILGLIILSKVKSKKKEKKLMVAKSLRYSNTIVLFTSGFIVLFCDLIITTLYGPAFKGSIEVTRYILVGVVLFNSFKILNSYYESAGKPINVLIFTLPSLIVNVIANFLLIPKYGINGAVWATNISYFVCSLLFTLRFSFTEKIVLKDTLVLHKAEVIEIVNGLKSKLKLNG